MTAMAVWWEVCALSLALVHGAGLVPRLPEPPDGADLGKIPYAGLTTRRRLAGLITMTLAAQMATVFAAPAQRPMWLVYGSAVAALAWVDACTTWLPSRLSWLVSAELAIAAAVTLCCGGGRLELTVRLLAGAATSWFLWWAAYHLSHGGFGFGDVRLAPLTGAMAATMGASGWLAALLATTVLGALWGLLTAHRHPAPGTSRGFAYGPWLWAGPYVALVWIAVM